LITAKADLQTGIGANPVPVLHFATIGQVIARR
jgi:hypothetical protein